MNIKNLSKLTFQSEIFRQTGWKFNKASKRQIAALVTLLFCSNAADATPFNGCTFYKKSIVSASYSDGEPDSGCAQFSAVNGRNGCKIVEGTCPYCVIYPGDHVQMWLPDYFIEVTRHIGKSVFAESSDGVAFDKHLKLGVKWWESSTKVPASSLTSNGFSLLSSRSSFWHARILVVPYGSWVNNYPPLGSSIGVGLPSCFSGLSEFFPAQWNENQIDAPFATAWSVAGIPLCLSPLGNLGGAAVQEAKNKVTALSTSSSVPTANLPVDLTCANPVGAKEGYAKNLLPTSAALSPLAGDLKSKLCMGSWGNLMPRTGWIESEDPFMSALMAAYKFQSLTGDFHLNERIKPQSSDKWQIVYPPRSNHKCFSPGSATLGAPPAFDSSIQRAADELKPGSPLKDHTYIIAVWRKRTACKRPTQYIKGYDKAFKANFTKNKNICDAAGNL